MLDSTNTVKFSRVINLLDTTKLYKFSATGKLAFWLNERIFATGGKGDIKIYYTPNGQSMPIGKQVHLGTVNRKDDDAASQITSLIERTPNGTQVLSEEIGMSQSARTMAHQFLKNWGAGHGYQFDGGKFTFDGTDRSIYGDTIKKYTLTEEDGMLVSRCEGQERNHWAVK